MTDSMDKNTLIENLAFALKELLLHKLDGLDRSSMDLNIDHFINDVVSEMTRDEILDKFYTPEQSLLLFMDYLAEAGALEESMDHTVH